MWRALFTREEAKLGVLFATVFLLAACYFLYQNRFIEGCVFLSTSVILVAISIFIPMVLKPFYKAWMILGKIIGMIVSPIVLGIIYFLLISPLAIFLRVVGRDELKLKTPINKSRWKKKENLYLSSFEKQF